MSHMDVNEITAYDVYAKDIHRGEEATCNVVANNKALVKTNADGKDVSEANSIKDNSGCMDSRARDGTKTIACNVYVCD